MRLCDLWGLAEELEDGACKRAVINNLIREKYWEVFSHATRLYTVVYGQPRAKTVLRAWLIDSVLPLVTPGYLDQHLNDFPPDMAVDLFKAFAASKGAVSAGNRPKESNAEKYY